MNFVLLFALNKNICEKLKLEHFKTHSQIVEMGKFGGFAENSNISHTTDLSCVCGWILFYSLRWTRIFVRNWNWSIFRHIVKLLKWANLVVLLKIQIFRILQIWVVFADEFCSTLCAEQEYLWEVEIGAFYENLLH